jgi:hypothetical protein
MSEQNKALIGLDNFKRGSEEETKLNDVFKTLFSTPIGVEVLQYLKSITIDSVAGPEISDHALRHLEGQRYLVGLIQRRINKGKSQNIIKENQNG